MLEADLALAEHSTGRCTARSRPDGSRRGSFKIQRRGSAANRAFANLRAKKSEILGTAPTGDSASRSSVGGALSSFLSAVGGTCTRRGVPEGVPEVEESALVEESDVGTPARHSSGSIEDTDVGTSDRHSSGVARASSAGSTSSDGGESDEPSERPQHTWSASQWIKAHKIDEILAEAVLAPILGHDPSGVAQFTYCKGLTRDDLHELLQGEDVLDLIEERLWGGVVELGETPAAGGQDLSAKFASEASYMLEFGSVDTYYSGLEALLGPPAMDPADAMRREFCEGPDADNIFTTSNGITTTSRAEYEFVAQPVEGKAYPERKELIGKPELRRKPLHPDHFKEQLARKNAELIAAFHSPLIEEEQIAGRLYTGPAYEKLNLVLRAQSGNTFLKMRCKELCQSNTYATTIHAVSSCVLKLSKLAVASKVYRGLKGASLPKEFFEPNEHGICGGIEFGFTSTSRNKKEALAYATTAASGEASAACPTLLELEQGMVSRGADVSLFSQYPHEREVLFSPLLGVEVDGTAVEGGVLVVRMRLTVNVTALTLEQQLSKRRRLVQQMCDNIRNELKADLARPAWGGMAVLRGPDGDDGHTAAEATLKAELDADSSHPPEYYNDDQAWGDAIARAVSGAQQVGSWPGALQKLCEAAHETPKGLMHAKQLVLGFATFGQAEAEVLELLLNASTLIHGLTLHDGGLGHTWDEARWARCVAAIARGIKANRTLLTLNLRHFSLRGAAGEAMAGALKQHASLTALRMVRNELAPPHLALAIRGNDRLRTLALQDNPMADAPLTEVCELVGSSPNLASLRLANCQLGGGAGTNLAEALRASTALRLPLTHLELQSNKLDSSVGLALAASLRGNERCTELNLNNNRIDAHAATAVKEALEEVERAWRRTDEGKAHAKAHGTGARKGGGASNFLGDLLNLT